MAARLQTSRGTYLLSIVGEAERGEAAAIVTVALERADGIERVAFRCAIPDAWLDIAGDTPNFEAVVERLRPWVARRFEELREAALKSVRAERRLLEVRFEEAGDL